MIDDKFHGARISPHEIPAEEQRKPRAVGLPDDNPKTTIGVTKPSTDGIPPVAILHLGQAMADGVRKYGKFNWREKRVSVSVYTNAIDRHLLAYRDGEDVARDSGHHHLAHVMSCCAILLDAEACGQLNDDRGSPGECPNLIDWWTIR